MKKIILLLLLSSLTVGCGFTPVYVLNDSVNFRIKKVTFEGDEELNNFINIGLKKYALNNNTIGYDVSTDTVYEKKILSKDTKGNAQSFKLKVVVNFIVTANNQSTKYEYTEQSELNNSDDTFELNSYENSIKQNFASSIIEKFILDLSNR